MSDFIVIGGGIAGVSAAARLAPHGRVTVLERESALAYHASGRSAALYEANYGKGSTVALNIASEEYHRTAHGGVLSPRGILLVGSPHTAGFEADCTAMKLDEITIAEALALCPILDDGVIERAAHDPEAWDIDTDRLVQNFAREVRAAGGVIETGAGVDAIRREAQGWIVTAGGRDYEGKVLVNAAGAWADEVAKLAGIAPLGLTPLRRSMARIAAPGGRDVSRWPLVIGAGEEWYFKPDAGAIIVSPAEEDPNAPMDAWADDMVLAEGLARYQAHVTEEVTRPLSSWAGLRTFSPDRELVIGPEPGVSGYFWCAGQGGYGMQSSPGASQLLADLVTGAAHGFEARVVAALDPARFR